MHAFARWLAIALAVPATLAAQKSESPDHKSDSTSHKPGRLFRTKETVPFWLESDFKTVFKDRDTTTGKTKRYPAVLRLLGDKGDTVSMPVQLATRGSFRLQLNRGGCACPPLKVYFDKEKTKGTLFSGQGSLKLVTHCNNGDRYAQNVLIEYAIYGMYNRLTPISLKARLASVTWLDPMNPKFTVTRPGIWLQDDDELAQEVRGKILKVGGHADEMEPRQMAITDVFQYMIANTDMSLQAAHNYRIIQTDTSMNYYPLAYDFDWSGLVDAPYARPDYRLAIKRTTDRLYRSAACHPPELLGEVTALFKAQKDSIYGVLRSIKELTPARLKEATGFLDEFYKELNDPGTVRRVFSQPCNR
jgi:hypothetical protein